MSQWWFMMMMMTRSRPWGCHPWPDTPEVATSAPQTTGARPSPAPWGSTWSSPRRFTWTGKSWRIYLYQENVILFSAGVWLWPVLEQRRSSAAMCTHTPSHRSPGWRWELLRVLIFFLFSFSFINNSDGVWSRQKLFWLNQEGGGGTQFRSEKLIVWTLKPKGCC